MSDETTATAMDNPPIEITLAGHSFTFREPGRRRSKQILAKAVKVCAGYEDLLREASAPGGLGEDTKLDSVTQSIDLTDRVYDFLYDVLAVSTAQRQDIDARATDDELVSAFNRIMETLTRPFSGSTPSTDAAIATIPQTP